MTKNNPTNKIIGHKDKGVMTRSRINEELCLISQVEPKMQMKNVKMTIGNKI